MNFDDMAKFSGPSEKLHPELSCAPDTSAVLEFAQRIKSARDKFVPGDNWSWLTFYNSKQDAYRCLVVAHPCVKSIPDFWRLVQNRPVREWLPYLEREVQRLAREQNVERQWQQRAAEARKAMIEKMRKCSVCKKERLVPRQRICQGCKAEARRERNRRYQKSLKDGFLRRLQPNSTGEKIPQNREDDSLGGQPKYAREGVLTEAVA